MSYKPIEREWLLENYPKLGTKEATRQFNERFGLSKSVRAINKFCRTVLDIKVDAEVTSRLLSENHNHSCKNVTARRFYEENETEWLIENYPKLGTHEATRQFNERFNRNKNRTAIQRYCTHALGLTVDKEVTRGLKSVPIGYSYRNCRGEWKIKTEEGWKILTHTIKEVPKGYMAFHLDGDSDNNSPENIAVIKNGIQTIARNCNMISENPTITSVGLTWSELYSELKKQKRSYGYVE